MSLCAARALLWRQRACATWTSFSPLAPSLRWSSSANNGDDDIAKARKAAALAELLSRQREAASRADKAASLADKAKAEATEAANRADKVKAETAEAANRAAEAANRADKVKAETLEAANRADKVKAETAEAANRADKVKVETAKIISETDTSAKTANDSFWARRVLVGAVVLGGLFLAYDHHTHHNRAYLRRRIRRVLIEGPRESLLPSPPPFTTLPLPPFPIANMNRPVLILGASGSGKSTQMGELAREFKMKGVPVVYFRFRSSREVATRQLAAHGQDLPQSPPQEGALKAPTLTVAAQRFYQAVGYPERPSYWNLWVMNGFKLSWGGAELSVSPLVVTARFNNAITDLFAVCGELYHERKADQSIPVADRAPVVLSDELHDLLHERYHNEGGKDVFAHFGSEMTQSCTDDRVSRVVLAASGAELLDKLESMTSAGGDRVYPYMQPDPPESVVRQRLAALGYDQVAMDSIVATCGARVRLLYPFLQSRLEDVPFRLQSLKASAGGRVETLMARCPDKAERDVLVQLLDGLAESPSASEPVGRLPRAVQDPFPNRVLLRGVNQTATFQTEAVRQAWKRVRGKYV
jgi:hypothetical protein